MYYDIFQRYKKRIIFGAMCVLGIIIALTVGMYVTRSGKVAVTIAVVPADAVITIGDQRYGNGTQWLKPGTYTASATKDGFATSKKPLIVTDKKAQNVMSLSLKPESDEAKKWAKNHQDDYARNEQYGAIEANNEGRYFADTHPITTKLPFNDPYFTIGYTVGENDSITLTVATPSPRYRFYAVEKIRELGYDPTDFVITFKDFHNPLEQQ